MSDALYEQMVASHSLHAEVVDILRAVHLHGGHFSWENPPSSLALLEPLLQTLFSDCKCDVVVVPACKFGRDWAKRWAFVTTWPPLVRLGGICEHKSHNSLLGRDASGNFKSSRTAEYPPGLAEAFATCVRPLLSTGFVFVDAWTVLNVPPHKQAFRAVPNYVSPYQQLTVTRPASGIFPNGWGNPFKVDKSSRIAVLNKFYELVDRKDRDIFLPLQEIPLRCVCTAQQGCHAETLADAGSAIARRLRLCPRSIDRTTSPGRALARGIVRCARMQ